VGVRPGIRGAPSLAESNPVIAAQWHPQKNDCTPADVAGKGTYRAWWMCPNGGHEWGTMVVVRTRGSNCPVCANRIAAAGINDVPTVNPSVASEWDRVRNESPTPVGVGAFSTKPGWWVCSVCEYSWRTPIRRRALEGGGCARCAGQVLWPGVNDLASRRPDVSAEWHASRNGTVAPVDVFVASTKKFWWQCSECAHEWRTTPATRSSGSGCPSCAGQVLTVGVNDLASRAPMLLAEWDYDRNDVAPNAVSAGSKANAWWVCQKCAHSWRAQSVARVRGTGCPACSGRTTVSGLNDLAHCHPALAAEWHPIKNGAITAAAVHRGASYRAWWQCPTCSHEWQSPVNTRARGTRCPHCANHGFQKNSPALVYFLVNDTLRAFKVGIAGLTSTRLKLFGDDGWDVLHTDAFDVGVDARTVEKAVHRWWRDDLGLAAWLGPEDMGTRGGFTETICSDELTRYEVIHRLRAEAARVRLARAA
jgi:Zn finger protein HypA/HybF involved in hydrogenase expression